MSYCTPSRARHSCTDAAIVITISSLFPQESMLAQRRVVNGIFVEHTNDFGHGGSPLADGCGGETLPASIKGGAAGILHLGGARSSIPRAHSENRAIDASSMDVIRPDGQP